MPALVLLLIAIALIAFLAFKIIPASCSSGSTIQDDSIAVDSDTSQADGDGRITMTLGGSQETYVLVGEEYLEAGCHAVDAEDGNITDKVDISGKVNTDNPGDYTITYKVKNSARQKAVKQRTVHVVEKMDKNTKGIPVLMYHYVYTKDDKPDELNSNWILDTELEKQLKWLTDEGYYFPSYQELRAWVDGKHSLPAKSAILTFDDGNAHFLKYGIPLLEKYKVPATSFIICDRDASATNIIKYASEYITFQSHSYGMHTAGTHQIGHSGKIYDLSAAEVKADQEKCKELLGTNEAFAYPYGDVSDVAPAALAETGLLCAFTTEYGKCKIGADPMRLPRVRVQGDNSLEGYKASVEN